MTNNAGDPGLEQRLDELSTGIGARIRLARRDRNLTQSSLGAELGLTPQQIAKYETAQSRITAPMLMVIAEKLGVSTSSLLGLSEDKEPSMLREMSTVDNLRLLRAASALSSAVRSQVVRLIETLAGEGA